MNVKQIKITVKNGGQAKVEVSGYAGGTCTDATKFLEKLGVVEQSQKTPEFYQTEEQAQGLEQG